jgi:CheY-like chemotaxis protein
VTTPQRPLVLLAIDDATLCASRAYGLTATGFDVATLADLSRLHSAPRPDIVLMALPERGNEVEKAIETLARNLNARDTPIVAMVPDVGPAMRARARGAGCAAVCLRDCALAVLAAGLRAVLERTERDTSPVR